MKKTRQTIFFWLFLLIGYCVSAQEAGKRDAILWEISGNGLTEPSYLLGTCHIVPYIYTDSIPGYKEAYASVRQVIIEHDVRPESLTALMPRLQASMMLPSDTTYAMLYSPEELQELNQFLQSAGMGSVDQIPLRPAILSFFISLGLESIRLQGQEPMDVGVVVHGLADGKEAVFFETQDEAWDAMQYLLFSKGLKEQAQDLLKTIRDMQKKQNPLVKLVSDYKAQQIEGVFEGQYMTPQDMERLVYKRNARWMEKIPALLSAKPTLIAVGAGHLIGEKGLVQELRTHGYKLRPLSL
ncbi:TraB/GumN family protein [Porphyromonas gulae]|uniref:TraB/GumN family protein n=1 Tax=Porphyromonas gulae TaxID=111105 RepID=UPI0026E9A8E3|nr:TraB/GumN family protein [Porphyromonas gulae]